MTAPAASLRPRFVIANLAQCGEQRLDRKVLGTLQRTTRDPLFANQLCTLEVCDEYGVSAYDRWLKACKALAAPKWNSHVVTFFGLVQLIDEATGQPVHAWPASLSPLSSTTPTVASAPEAPAPEPLVSAAAPAQVSTVPTDDATETGLDETPPPPSEVCPEDGADGGSEPLEEPALSTTLSPELIAGAAHAYISGNEGRAVKLPDLAAELNVSPDALKEAVKLEGVGLSSRGGWVKLDSGS